MEKYDIYQFFSQQNKLKLPNYIIIELIAAFFITLLNNDHKLQKANSSLVSTDADNNHNNSHNNDDNDAYNTKKLQLYRLISGIAK